MSIPAEFLKKVRTIELSSRRLVKKGLVGGYLSAFRGSGMQFREFRQYVYGDDVRHIAWNVSARAQAPVLKTFEEERDRTFFMLVDVSASLRKGPWAQAKAERLAEIAATLALSAAAAKDKMGLMLFTDRVEKVIPPASGKTHLLRIIRDVLAFEPEGTKTNPEKALRQLETVLKKQSIVFLLSDFEALPKRETLRQAVSQHQFVAVGVEDPREWKLPPFGFIEMETAEGGRPVTVDSRSRELQEYMQEHGATRKRAAQDLFTRAGADLLWVNTSEDYVPVLQSFFQSRGRRRGAR